MHARREYSLPGSYRKMINVPSRVDWTHMTYTDPNLALSQSDEDKLLGLPAPETHDPNGKFKALQIELELGSAAYATMAIREVTCEETSSRWQSELTEKGEDRGFRGAGEAAGAEEPEAVEVDA